MKKHIFGFLLALVLVAAFSLTAFAAEFNYANETVTLPVNTEYSVDGTTWFRVWEVGGRTLDISHLIVDFGATPNTILTRIAGQTETLTVTIPARPDAPDTEVTVNNLNYTLTSAAPFQARIGLGTWQTSSGTPQTVSIADVFGQRVQVRFPADNAGNAFASTPATITLPDRPVAPLATDVVYNPATNQIEGVTNAMQVRHVAYPAGSFVGNDGWTAITTAPNLARPAIGGADARRVEIRFAAASGELASHPLQLIVPASPAAMPTGAIDFVGELVSGVADTQEFTFTPEDAASWVELTGTAIVLETAIAGGAIASTPRNVYIRVRDTDPSNNATQPGFIQILEIPARPAAPVLTFDGSGITSRINIAGGLPGVVYRVGTGTFEDADTTDSIVVDELIPNHGDTPVTVGVRNIAVSATPGPGRFVSAIGEINIPARPATPAPTYDAINDFVLNVNSTMSFTFNPYCPDENTALYEAWTTAIAVWTPVVGTSITRAQLNTVTNETVLSDLTEFPGGNVYVRVRGTTALPPSLAGSINVPALTTPDLTIDFAEEILTGATAAMQHRVLGTNPWTNVPAGDLNITPLITGAERVFEFRYAAVGSTRPASPIVEVTIPARPAAPTAAIDFGAEEITVTAAANAGPIEWLVGSTWTEYDAASDDFNITGEDATDHFGTTLQFRSAAVDANGNGSFRSNPVSLVVPNRPAAPLTTGFDAEADVITGVTAAMEFAVGDTVTGATTWLAVGASNTTIARTVLPVPDRDDGGRVNIRFAHVAPAEGVTGAFASVYAFQTFPAAPGNAPNISTSDINFADYVLEIPSDLNSDDLQWRILPAAAWNSMPAGADRYIDITPGVTVQVRLAGPPVSAIAVINVPERTAVVTGHGFDTITEVLTTGGATQFRIPAVTAHEEWAAVAGANAAIAAQNGAVAVQLRVAPNTGFASATVTVNVPARATMPARAPEFVIATNRITNTSNAMEWNVTAANHAGAWTRSTGNFIDVAAEASIVVPNNGATNVFIRVAATASVRSSAVVTVRVTDPNYVADAPAITSANINWEHELLTGVTTAMQFRIGEGAWQNVTITQRGGVEGLNLTPHIPARPTDAIVNPATIQLRYRAITGGLDGAATTPPIQIPARPFIATGADGNRFQGSPAEGIFRAAANVVLTLPNGDVVPAANTFFAFPATNTAQTVVARVPHDTAAFASLPINIAVPARAAAPRPVYTIATDVITGVTEAMEFSLNGGDTWTDVTVVPLTRTHFGDLAATMLVRVRATATLPSSQIGEVVIPDGAGDMPMGLQLTPEYILIGVSNVMEFSVNNGASWTRISGNQLDTNPHRTLPGGANVTLLVRYAMGISPPSASQTFTLTPRAAATVPTPGTLNFSTERIPGIDTTMEFSINNGSRWVRVTAAMVDGSGFIVTNEIPRSGSVNMIFRVAAAGGLPASDASAPIVIPARPSGAPPAANHRWTFVSGNQGTVTVGAGFEARLGTDGPWIPTADLTVTMLSTPQTVQVRIAPDTGFSSAPLNVAIPAIPAAPTGLSVNNRGAIAGVNATMEFRVGTVGDWINVTGSNIPATAFSSGDTVYVRVRATAAAPASGEASITIS